MSKFITSKIFNLHASKTSYLVVSIVNGILVLNIYSVKKQKYKCYIEKTMSKTIIFRKPN